LNTTKLKENIKVDGDKTRALTVTDLYKSTNAIINVVTSLAVIGADRSVKSWEEDLDRQLQLTNSAESRFKEIRSDMEVKGNNFTTSYNAYQEKRREEEKFDKVMLVTEVVLDVGLIMYKGPTALFNSTKKLTDEASKLKGLKNELKGKDRWKRIGQLCSNLEKVHKVIDAVKTFTKIFKDKGESSNLAERFKAASSAIAQHDGFDWGELKASLDDFEIESEEWFKEDISRLPATVAGASDYHIALKKFVMRGRDLFTAQKDAQDLRNKLRQAVAYKELLETRSKGYELPPPPAQEQTSDKKALEATKYILTKELQSVKRWLFVVFHERALAWAYLNGLATLPEPVKFKISDSLSTIVTRIASFQSQIEDMSKIAYWQTRKSPKDYTQSEPLVISSDDPKTKTFFDGNWMQTLEKEKLIRFAIDKSVASGLVHCYVTEAT
jgi:hypothetical protein